MKFPEDFIRQSHPVIPGATQWLLGHADETIISVVGGSHMVYGNGVTTFEMFDFREAEPQGYLTKEDINQHLKDNPIAKSTDNGKDN